LCGQLNCGQSTGGLKVCSEDPQQSPTGPGFSVYLPMILSLLLMLRAASTMRCDVVMQMAWRESALPP